MKPILFKDIMVRAILADNKTQTRREKGLNFLNKNPDEWTFLKNEISQDGKKFILIKDTKDRIAVYSNSPYGWIGDRLWVREAFHLIIDSDTKKFIRYGYRADYNYKGAVWKPSIHMPRKASRITLEIVDIRIERLMDISEQDAIAEGVEIVSNYEDDSIDVNDPDSYLARDYCDGDPNACTDTAIFSFHTLWQSINGIESYKKNPWVWVIVFKRQSV